MRPWLKKLLRGLVVVCLCAVAVEAAVRVYFATQVGAGVLLYGVVDGPHDDLFDPKGAVLRWDEKYANTAIHDNVFENYSKYFPNQKRIHPDESGKTIPATINSNGFRGKEFERKKKPGVIRVVTLGASSTFGFKTRDDHTYPYLLEQALNKAAPAKYEVINLGIPHMQSDQIYSLFVAEGVPLEPDIVTYYQGFTDAAASPRDEAVVQGVKRIPFVTSVFREMRHRSLLVAVFAKKSFSRTYAPLNAVLSGFGPEAEMKRERFMKNLDAIYQECKKRNIRFILATEQTKSLLVEREKMKGLTYAEEAALVRKKLAAEGGVQALEKYFLIHNDMTEAERQWAKSNNVPLADVIGAMDANRQYLIDWMHLNEQATPIVAAALSDKIINLPPP